MIGTDHVFQRWLSTKKEKARRWGDVAGIASESIRSRIFTAATFLTKGRKQLLSEKAYPSISKTIKTSRKLGPSITPIEWPCHEKLGAFQSAMHYTHWFQPFDRIDGGESMILLFPRTVRAASFWNSPEVNSSGANRMPQAFLPAGLRDKPLKRALYRLGSTQARPLLKKGPKAATLYIRQVFRRLERARR